MNSYHAVIMLSSWNDQVQGIRDLSAEPKAKADNTYLDIDIDIEDITKTKSNNNY